MERWLKIGIVIAIFLVFTYIGIQYARCKKKGNELGVPYNCPIFCGTPVMMIAQDEYYDIKFNKCYRFTDYGDNMSVREVDMSYCS